MNESTQSNRWEDVFRWPWWARYPAAAGILAGGYWLISSNPNMADWKLLCIVGGSVIGAACVAYELGCLAAVAGLAWGGAALLGVAVDALPDGATRSVAKATPWIIAMVAGYHLLRLHESNESLQRRVNSLEASRERQNERIAWLEEFRDQQKAREWSMGSDSF